MPYTQTNCQACTMETVGESFVACTAVSISCLGQSNLSNSFNFDQFLGLPECLLCIIMSHHQSQTNFLAGKKKQSKNDDDDYDGL